MTLSYDPDHAVSTLIDADEQLAYYIEQVGPFDPEVRAMGSVFEALVRAIVYQQLSGSAAATIHGRVQALFPEEVVRPRLVLDTPDEALRGAGMSRAKVKAVKDLAAKTLDGTVPTLAELKTMDNDDIVARLVKVHGIGRWTAEMLLLARLGRPDVLPTTDLGIRKGVQTIYDLADLPTPSEVKGYGERWRPYRSVASWYLWRVVDLDDGS